MEKDNLIGNIKTRHTINNNITVSTNINTINIKKYDYNNENVLISISDYYDLNIRYILSFNSHGNLNIFQNYYIRSRIFF